MKLLRGVLFWVLAISLVSSLFSSLNETKSRENQIDYTDFVREVTRGNVTSVEFLGDGFTMQGLFVDGTEFTSTRPAYITDDKLMDDLLANNVQVSALKPEERSVFAQILINVIPLALAIMVLLYFTRQSQGGSSGGPLSFGRSKAKILEPGTVEVRLTDVAGCEEAKEEVAEVVDFLRDPERYRDLGGRIPRGILMVGPPGTGKTLIARAIAGEANCAFLTISGSDFVEMFVGVGAARVRNMFVLARSKERCIVFVDEIDAVGRHRGAGMGGGHDEREQTLNQLLVEMDGFDGDTNVIVIAATNRPDVLDPALLRPGRFDRQVVVDLPDVTGREAILKVHAEKIRLAPEVSLHDVARGTPGFSGADLENLLNESALMAAREKLGSVTKAVIEKARDKLMIGTERRSLKMTEKDRRLTAFHESGHAILGALQKEHDPVFKVTIMPRGRALGVTTFLPEGDVISHSRSELRARLISTYGGRIAEEIVYGEDAVTTGAANDIKVATKIARSMVTQWGFSDGLGPILYEDDASNPFLGRTASMQEGVTSPDTLARIDKEVRQLVENCYTEARQMLSDNRDLLDRMAEVLMERETIGAAEIQAIMKREELPANDLADSHSGDRPRQDKVRNQGKSDAADGKGAIDAGDSPAPAPGT